MIIYKYKSLNFVLRLANNTSLPNCSFNVQWTFYVLKICVQARLNSKLQGGGNIPDAREARAIFFLPPPEQFLPPP